MKRLVFALVLGAGFVLAGTIHAHQPEGSDKSQIIERLDAILKRLDEIESRLTQLEADNRLLADWWVDERGVMRLRNGRPIGFWGIDDPDVP